MHRSVRRSRQTSTYPFIHLLYMHQYLFIQYIVQHTNPISKAHGTHHTISERDRLPPDSEVRSIDKDHPCTVPSASHLASSLISDFS